jgi:DNA-directed RNA polymerase subunit alpha
MNNLIIQFDDVKLVVPLESLRQMAKVEKGEPPSALQYTGAADSLFRKVDHLYLSVRACNALTNAGFVYVGDVVQKRRRQIQRTPNLGRKSLNEIENLLHASGLSFGMTVPNWPPANVEELSKELPR